MKKVTTFLVKSFELKPEEIRIFLLLFFHSFFLGLFIAFYFVPANSVFIKHFGSEHLPIAYIVSGIAGFASTSIYSALQKRINSQSLFLGALFFMFVITILGRTGLAFISEKWLSFFVFIWAWPFISLVGIEAGGLSLRFLNLVQVKRLFGLFNVGGVIAAILGYLAIPLLTPILSHAYDLLFIGLVGLIISIIILIIMYRNFPEKSYDASKSKSSDSKTTFSQLFKQRYFLLIFISAILSMVAIYLTDFGFLSTVKVQIPQENLSQYLSLVYGGLKIGELIISVFSSRLLSKYGVKLGLTVLPIVSCLLVLFALIFGFLSGVESVIFLIFMTLNKSFERILRRGLDDPAFNILYQPLPNSEKLNVQTKVGIVMQSAIAIAGAILFLINYILVTPDGFQLKYYSLFFLPILAIWVFISSQLYLSYKAKIRQILADISKDKRKDTAKYQYGTEVLKRQLKKNNKQIVALSVTILSETNPRMLEAYAASLLEDETDPQIHKALLRNIDPTWRQRIYDSVDKVIHNFSGAEIKKLAERVKDNLDYSKIKTITDDEVKTLIKSENLKDKLTLIKYIYKGKYKPDESLILSFLEDKEKVIKTSAINLVGKIKSPALISKLVELIKSDQYYHIVANVLLDIGDKVLLELDKYFETDASPEVLSRVVEIYAKIGSAPAKSLLVSHIDHSNREIQMAVIWALYFCRYQAEGKETQVIKKKLEQVVENILWIYATIIDIEEEKNTLKLFLALDHEREFNFSLLFQLLSFLYEPRIITLIQKNIIGKNTIFALEIIDNFISQDIKALIVPLFDDISSQQKIKKMHDIFPQEKLIFTERLRSIVTREFYQIETWTITKAIELLGRIHKSHSSKRAKSNFYRNYADIDVWTKDAVHEKLEEIRRSEMPDEIFVCLYHSDELVFSTAAKIIHEENPIKCFDYLINMTPQKQELMSVLSNSGIILSDKVRLIKRHPMFFNIPENLLVKLAKEVTIIEVKKNDLVSITNQDGSDNVLILLKGALVFNKGQQDEEYYFKYDIIIRGINLDQSAENLLAKKDTMLMSVHRFEYFNLLINETELIRHIFSETQSGDDDKDDNE